MTKTVDVSVIVPTKNEKIAVANFITWCNEGFLQASVSGEIILVDNSDDDTRAIAKSKGARIIEINENGLGNAYRLAKDKVNGKYVILGDADCTYDFRNITPFLSALDNGFDFVVGNRFTGKIQKGAMPFHHQYFGSPATSFIFKRGLGIPIGDIHCGMRAMTGELFNSLPFIEGGWEYATEMIVSARNLNAKMTEVPIDFLKEPEGRVSHHKRSSWLSPFRAGWGTLRVTATYLIDRLFVIPGFISLWVSLVLNSLIFIFPKTSLNIFHAGILTQSTLVFISSLGAFTFTTGQLARFAYRRKLSSMKIISNINFAKRLFSILIVTTFIEFYLSFFVLVQWLHGLESGVNQINNSFLISGWLSFTSIYFCILSISSVSLIGCHAQKLTDLDYSKAIVI